jgi:hypothetical protein
VEAQDQDGAMSSLWDGFNFGRVEDHSSPMKIDFVDSTQMPAK